MKGLFVKDVRLMMAQKNFFFLIIAAAIGMAVFTDDISFPLGFLTFVISLFSLSTISYDEFDNGNAFLFTLPITRTSYVVEKYCLGLILGCGTWVFAAILAIVTTIFKETVPMMDFIITASITLPLVIILQAIMLPFQLKFGAEKGRIAIIGVVGIATIISVIVVKGAKAMFNIDIVDTLNALSTIGIGTLVAAATVIAAIFFLISLKASISIMKKKEF